MKTDSVADLLTRVRNAQRAGHASVTVPHFNFGERILALLKKEGFIDSVDVMEATPRNECVVGLKYYGSGRPAMSLIKRVSKPGRRVYTELDKLPKVMCGLGVVVVSTSQGLMTDREARRKKIGGEVVAVVG